MNEKLGRLTPFAAFGFILCGVGAIWTWIEHFRYIAEVNKLRPASNLQWWPIFIPVYGNIVSHHNGEGVEFFHKRKQSQGDASQ